MRTETMESFEFASFKFPRHIPRLVAPDYSGLPMALSTQSGRRHKFKINTSYYGSPTPGSLQYCFYLDSDFMPGLRWEYAQSDRLRPIRGIVMRLPHNKGFLAGWTMGENMGSGVDKYIWGTIEEARSAAIDEANRLTYNEQEEMVDD